MRNKSKINKLAAELTTLTVDEKNDYIIKFINRNKKKTDFYCDLMNEIINKSTCKSFCNGEGCMYINNCKIYRMNK